MKGTAMSGRNLPPCHNGNGAGVMDGQQLATGEGLLRVVRQMLKPVKDKFYASQAFSASFRHIVLSNLLLPKIENPA